MYICVPQRSADGIADMVQRAIQNEASALLMPSAHRNLEGLDIPPSLPVHWVPSPLEVADRLAVAFYGAQGLVSVQGCSYGCQR